MQSFVSLLVAFLATSAVWAQPALFEQVCSELFHTSHYESGDCGTNIMKFVDQLQRRGAEFSRANILKVTSPGFVHLVGLRGYNARNQGRLISPQTFRRDMTYPDHVILRTPGEKMWYHHVVLELDGIVYDFDFLNEPTPTPVAQYFAEMFYPDGLKGYAGKPDFPQKVKVGYSIEVIPVAVYLEHRARGRSIASFVPGGRSVTLSLESYLQTHSPLANRRSCDAVFLLSPDALESGG